MNYGKIGRWKRVDKNEECHLNCHNSSHGHVFVEAQWRNQGDNTTLCTPCYINEVIIPNTEPIKEVTPDLVGREVVRVEESTDYIIKGGKYKIERIYCRNFKLVGVNLTYYSKYFRLLPKADLAIHEPGCNKDCDGTFECSNCKRKIGYCYGGDGDELCNDCWEPKESQDVSEKEITKPQTKITHSCTLEFPNGETIVIPGPEGPEWMSSKYNIWPPENVCATDEMEDFWYLHANREDIKYHIKHISGKLLAKEFSRRIFKENPVLVSLTKWTRNPNWKPEPEDETFKQRACRRHPSRWRINNGLV